MSQRGGGPPSYCLNSGPPTADAADRRGPFLGGTLLCGDASDRTGQGREGEGERKRGEEIKERRRRGVEKVRRTGRGEGQE